jgi:hypothetical protein
MGILNAMSSATRIILAVIAAVFLLVPTLCWVAGIPFPGQYVDYEKKSQVSEGPSMADGLRRRVVDFHTSHGAMPASNSDIGLPTPSKVTGKYISRLEVLAGGAIEVTYSSRPPQSAAPVLDGATLRFKPVAVSGGRFTWKCSSETLPQKYCASACACNGPDP